MRKIGRLIDGVSYVSGYLCGWVLLLAMTLTLVEVISRYIVRRPLILADEFAGYMLVLMSLVGIAYTLREKGHIRITFIISLLPVKVSNWLRVITLTMFLVYVSVAASVSYSFVQGTVERGIKSNSWLMTPLVWPQIALPVGFTLLFLALLVEIAKAIRNISSGVSTEAIAKEKTQESGG